MRVNRDDALRITTERTGEQLREALTTAGVSVGTINVTSPTSFRVEGVPQDKDVEFRRIAEEQTATNYERSSGVGGAYDFTMRPNIARGLREQTMVQAQDTIDRRVNEFGVTEPNIATHGDDGDQLLVQLPGVTDVARAKNLIQSPALLEIKLVEGGPAPNREALLQAHNGQVPSDMEVVTGAADSTTGDGATSYYLVRKVAAVNRQRPAHGQRRSRREQPARGHVLAQARRRAEVRPGHRVERRAGTSPSCSTTGCSRTRGLSRGSAPKGESPAASTRRRRRTSR